MVITLAKGALGVALILVGWVMIERLWSRVFADLPVAPDGKCQGGGCLSCSRRRCEHEEDEGASAPRGRGSVHGASRESASCS